VRRQRAPALAERRTLMNEVSFLAGEAAADLRDRLDEEISAFN
jgi:hypothetical protein